MLQPLSECTFSLTAGCQGFTILFGQACELATASFPVGVRRRRQSGARKRSSRGENTARPVEEVTAMSEASNEKPQFPRRTFLKIGAECAAAVAAGTGASMIVPELRRKGLMSGDGVFEAASMALADDIYEEVYPTSPLILHPFIDELMIPKALSPVSASEVSSWTYRPGPGEGEQNSLRNETHQLWPSSIGYADPL